MPDVTPTGPLSNPFEQTAILLAACTTLRTECGVASASEMEEFLHYPYYYQGEDDNEWPIPGVILNDDDLNDWFIEANLDQAGAITVTFCFEPNSEYVDDPKNQILDFRNKLGTIIEKEVLKLRNTPNPSSPDGLCYINIFRVEKASTPLLLEDPKHAKVPIMHAAFIFHWVA
tara:strand:- start:18901 stop:19419 length:519 start_codon:yes stop_codon:yes gene_type:complete